MLALSLLILTSLLLLWLTWKDYQTMTLPNWANAFILIFGLMYHILVKQNSFLSWQSMALGVALGGGILAVSWFLFKRLKKVDGLGMGDIKFCCAAGIWLGIEYTAHMLFLSSFLLLVMGAIYALYTRSSFRDLKLPFGVTLAPVTFMLIWVHFGYQDLTYFFENQDYLNGF